MVGNERCQCNAFNRHDPCDFARQPDYAIMQVQVTHFADDFPKAVEYHQVHCNELSGRLKFRLIGTSNGRDDKIPDRRFPCQSPA